MGRNVATHLKHYEQWTDEASLEAAVSRYNRSSDWVAALVGVCGEFCLYTCGIKSLQKLNRTVINIIFNSGHYSVAANTTGCYCDRLQLEPPQAMPGFPWWLPGRW